MVYTSLPKYEPEYPDGDSMLLNIDIPEIEPEYPDGERGRGSFRPMPLKISFRRSHARVESEIRNFIEITLSN